MSEDEDSSSTGLSSTEDESLNSLPPLPKRFSSRASASPYRTADRIQASQRLQLAQGRTRSNLAIIQEEATTKKKPSSRSRLLPHRETEPQQSTRTLVDNASGQQVSYFAPSIAEYPDNATHPPTARAAAAAAASATPRDITTTKTTQSPVVCAICQESIPNVHKYFLPCFHVFHQQCIEDCFDHVPSTNPKRCPTCRFIVHPAESGVVDMTMIEDSTIGVSTRNTNVSSRSFTSPTLSSIQRSNETTIRSSNNIPRSPGVTTTTRATAAETSARAPRRRPAPTTTEQANVNVKRRSTTFTQSQINLIFDLCEEIKPIGEQGWKAVTERFLLRYPTSNKTWKSIRQKFNKLANVRYASLFNVFRLY